ncbi:calcium ion antiporter [Fragilaria crotonensis]|nr:calcium ion antiporter [Fragilaria crotonensis]
MTSMSNYDNATDGTSDQREGWVIDSDNVINERPIALHGVNGILSGDPHHRPEGHEPSVGNYAILEDGMDHICAEPGVLSAHNWRGAFQDGLYEFQTELHDRWKELFEV